MEEERLELENRRLADHLSNQVSHLKSVRDHDDYFTCTEKELTKDK